MLGGDLCVYLLCQYTINFIVLRIKYSQCFDVEWVVLCLNGIHLSLSLLNHLPRLDNHLLLAIDQYLFWEDLDVQDVIIFNDIFCI